ncbi:MAG: type I-G CRISPR-associated protein, Cas3-extension family [Syntrophales bacterium]
MNNWLLNGLDGGNPLAFLAALGTLRTATLAWKAHRCCLRWRNSGGGWRPELSIEAEENIDFITGLSIELAHMQDNDNDAFAFADDLSITSSQFAQKALQAAQNASHADRRFVDFLAAFGVGVQGQEKEKMLRTAFKLLGVAQTSFLGSIRAFVRDTKGEHISKALTEPWRYDDPVSKGHTMRWDPRDDIRRALRWSEPSGDPAREKQGSVWGANRLAIEGLPLLPTAPVGSRLETTGFIWRKGEGMFWSWPIWEGKLTVDVVRSLLALDELRKERPDRLLLMKMGISEVYRCQRISQGKYTNFSPALPA